MRQNTFLVRAGLVGVGVTDGGGSLLRLCKRLTTFGFLFNGVGLEAFSGLLGGFEAAFRVEAVFIPISSEWIFGRTPAQGIVTCLSN